jgi:hypothetical protein
MSCTNPTGCAERDLCTPASEDRAVEQAVLSFLLDEHPDHQLTIPEVPRRALNAKPSDFGSEDAIERASLLERGARVPRIDTLVKLASALNVPLACPLLDGIAWNPGSVQPGGFGVAALGGPTVS